eukprot:jgi/Botrbrau1/13906/Bobra.0017s0013.1
MRALLESVQKIHLSSKRSLYQTSCNRLRAEVRHELSRTFGNESACAHANSSFSTRLLDLSGHTWSRSSHSWTEGYRLQQSKLAVRLSGLQRLPQCEGLRGFAALTSTSGRPSSTHWRQCLARLKGYRLHSTAQGGVLHEIASHAPHAGAGKGVGAGLPREAQRALAWWLGGCSAWVFSMVVLGGVTRLTRSGLSMTDWKFTGERPPLSPADWETEFSKYRASPEYRHMNRGMSLEDFKYIYWMEYAHRMWGRVLGVVFAGPALYFTSRGWINRPLGRRLGLLFLMGGAQGLVGWWMVRSGLQEPREEWKEVRVSPYRLAAHLTSAFVIYGTLLWTTLQLAFPVPPALNPSLPAGLMPGLRHLRMWAHPLAGLISLTAFSGAFVAGLDAGRAYNTFPTMNGEWVPAEYWAVPGWRNAFENTAAVQFNHRVLALSTLTGVCAAWASHRAIPLPRPCRLLLDGLLFVTAAQVTLGVTTLLTYVPVSLGSAHQAGALTLFSLALGLIYSVKRGPKLAYMRAPVLAWWLTPAAAASLLLVGTGAAQLQ